MTTIDCRGLACPAPVLAVKRAIEAEPASHLIILLDAGAPLENVRRLVQNRGYNTEESITETGGELRVTPPAVSSAAPAAEPARRVLLITANRLGDGPAELGELLLKNFIISLLDQAILPERIIFLNTGIHLTTSGSEVLPALETLTNQGVEILSCGLCLDYFNKKDQLRAGTVTNMFTTAESLLKSDSVIRL